MIINLLVASLAGKDKCPTSFDDFACWPATAVDRTAYIPCPDYIHLFESAGRISLSLQVESIFVSAGRIVVHEVFAQQLIRYCKYEMLES